MPTFIMLTRLNPDAVRSPRGLEQLERDAMKRRARGMSRRGMAEQLCRSRALVTTSTYLWRMT
jgi:hypothetical protein